MSAFGIVALVLATLCLGAVTVALLAMVRQVALLTLRLDRTEEGPALDGISVGTEMPEALAKALPNGRSQPAHVLVLSATCAPCRELAEELDEVPYSAPVVALIGGDQPAAAAIGKQLPASVHVILDPEASRAIDSIDLRTSPFLFKFEGGKVADKASVRNAAHFLALLDRAPAGEYLPRAPSLEVNHVG